MNYFEKLSENPYKDMEWNIPEKKQGNINIIGGNSGSFKTEIKTAEFIDTTFPVQEIRLILPDALKGKIPSLPNFLFMPSTDVGTFAESQMLLDSFNATDYNIVLGDLSHNTETMRAIARAIKDSEKMTLVTRDAVDVIADNLPERILMNENVVFLASIAQLQKLLRSVYYPKMLLISSSLVQVAEILHKFTLSYPVGIITLHNGQILVSINGTVKAIALDKTKYSPISFWNGEVAGKIAGMNLYNPNKFVEATIAGIVR